MADKEQIITEIEDLLGSEGSRELASATFPLLKEDGYITFNEATGFTMTPVPDDDDTWTSMIAEASSNVR